MIEVPETTEVRVYSAECVECKKRFSTLSRETMANSVKDHLDSNEHRNAVKKDADRWMKTLYSNGEVRMNIDISTSFIFVTEYLTKVKEEWV